MYRMNNKKEITEIFDGIDFNMDDIHPSIINGKPTIYYTGDGSVIDVTSDEFDIVKINSNNSINSIVQDYELGSSGDIFTNASDKYVYMINNRYYHVDRRDVITELKKHITFNENTDTFYVTQNENIISVLTKSNDYYKISYFNIKTPAPFTLDVRMINDKNVVKVDKLLHHSIVNTNSYIIYEDSDETIKVYKRVLYGDYAIIEIGKLRPKGQYYKILNNNMICVYDNKNNSINFISLDKTKENGVLELIELPTIDNIKYDIKISSSGIATYKSNHKLFMIDLNYSRLEHEDITLNNIDINNGTDKLCLTGITARFTKNITHEIEFKNIGNTIKSNIGKFYNNDGSFNSNHYIDFEDDFTSSMFVSMNSISNTIKYDLDNMRFLMSNKSDNSDVLIEYAFIRPSTKYDILVSSGLLENVVIKIEYIDYNGNTIHTSVTSKKGQVKTGETISINNIVNIDMLNEAKLCRFKVVKNSNQEPFNLIIV